MTTQDGIYPAGRADPARRAWHLGLPILLAAAPYPSAATAQIVTGSETVEPAPDGTVREEAAPPEPSLLTTPPARPPRRYRITLAPQLQPGFPGNDRFRVEPLLVIARTRGDTPFPFGAQGDGNALPLLRLGHVEFGPMFHIEGGRREDDQGGDLPTFGRTLEVGGYAETWLHPMLRVRADLRRGIGGHRGWVSQLGVDAVSRSGDRWLISFGPRVVLADARYQRTFFEVTPAASLTSGLPVFRPGAGVRSVGVTSRATYALDDRWSLFAQGTLNRLTGDARRSPIVRRLDSAWQPVLAVGLSFTFGR